MSAQDAGLEMCTPGSRVADATGDLWTMQVDGTWLYRNGSDSASLTLPVLLHVWGPLHPVPSKGL